MGLFYMTNILDYIRWRGDLSFEKDPLNDIDALVFARLSYLDFSKIIGDDSFIRVTLRSASQLYDGGKILNENDPELIRLAGASVRFGDVQATLFRSILDEQEQLQFAGVTFLCNNGNGEETPVIAFRGTDSTFTGWKEDFNMSFMERIPSQEAASRYAVDVLEVFRNPAIFTGHSKGGNLSVYAACFSSEQIRKSTRMVFNFDGPGFNDELLNSCEYNEMLPKIKVIVPQTSMIGTLLGHREYLHVIKSCEKGLKQHDLYTWEVLGKAFTEYGMLSPVGIVMRDSFRDWLKDLDSEKRESFFNSVYRILENTNSGTLKELNSNKLKGMIKLYRSYRGMDEDSRSVTREVFKDFLKKVVGNTGNYMGEIKRE